MSPDRRSCTKCKLVKPLAEFSKAPRGLYGVKASCKACDAARHAALTADRVPKKKGRPKGAPIDPASPKACTKCEATKPHSEFSLARRETKTQRAVYLSWCKACSSTRALKWFADNPERTQANGVRYNLKSNYGLTVEQYDAMFRSQGGVYAICERPETKVRSGKTMRLCVDHCHVTNAVRGLLCNNCNRSLGLLKDDVELLRRAIRYLSRE